MKKIVFIVLLFPLSLLAQEHFYYYKGKKQPLQLDTTRVFIYTVNDVALQKSNLISKRTLNLHKEQILKQKQKISTDFYWTELKLSTMNEGRSYKERVSKLKQIEGVQTVSPYFIGRYGRKIGLSNFFYVKLKNLSDTTLLNKYCKKNKTIVVRQDRFMPLWFVLSCTKLSNGNAMEMANRFYDTNLFQYAEPDLMVDDLLNCTNDTYFSNQWGLRNTGQYDGTNGVDIKACDAWTLSTGTGITVAVVDQGIELNHPDLVANIHPLNFDTETGSSPSIVRGNHGVACAGIIGASGNNAIGIRGVAPNARLMSISNSLEAAPMSRIKRGEGINWAVQNGADIISNSWGSSVQYQIIDDAITNALVNGRNGRGCIVLFASGNDNRAVNYPANSNPNILTVGAISPCGQRKSPTSCDGEGWGSNYGSQLDVVAPGVLIPTTDRQGNLGYNPTLRIHTMNGGNKITSDYTNRDYTVWFNGTSAACPHVAGVAALILSVRPNLTGQQVRNIIEQTAQKVGGYSYATTSGRPNGTWHQEMGYGLVDAYAAVRKALMPSLSGPSSIYNEATYTVENLPVGSSVQWSSSSNCLRLISGQGTATATFKAIFNISAVITATISGPTSTSLSTGTITANASYNSDISFDVWNNSSGGYIGNTATGTSGLCPNTTYHFSLVNNSGCALSDLEWTVSPAWTIYYTQNNMISINTNKAAGGWISLKARTCCGTSGTVCSATLGSSSDCSNYRFTLSPNPATDEVTLQLMETDEVSGLSVLSTDRSPYEIQLWSGMTMLRSFRTNEPTFQISMAGLPAGLYFVRVVKDGQTYTQKLIKK